MWVVQEMHKHKVDMDKVAIGVIPFGTGNDFSRVLGWGGNYRLQFILLSIAHEPSVIVGPHLNNLKALVTKWTEAMVENFDIWDIIIETHEVIAILFFAN